MTPLPPPRKTTIIVIQHQKDNTKKRLRFTHLIKKPGDKLSYWESVGRYFSLCCTSRKRVLILYYITGNKSNLQTYSVTLVVDMILCHYKYPFMDSLCKESGKH